MAVGAREIGSGGVCQDNGRGVRERRTSSEPWRSLIMSSATVSPILARIDSTLGAICELWIRLLRNRHLSKSAWLVCFSVKIGDDGSS